MAESMMAGVGQVRLRNVEVRDKARTQQRDDKALRWKYVEILYIILFCTDHIMA